MFAERGAGAVAPHCLQETRGGEVPSCFQHTRERLFKLEAVFCGAHSQTSHDVAREEPPKQKPSGLGIEIYVDIGKKPGEPV